MLFAAEGGRTMLAELSVMEQRGRAEVLIVKIDVKGDRRVRRSSLVTARLASKRSVLSRAERRSWGCFQLTLWLQYTSVKHMSDNLL